MPFLSLSVISLHLDEIPLSCRTKFPHPGQNCPESYSIRRENSITYSWDHTDSHAVNSEVYAIGWKCLQTQTSLCWLSQDDIIMSRSVHLPHASFWTNFPHATLNSVLPFEISMMAKSFWHQYNNLTSRLQKGEGRVEGNNGSRSSYWW